jgi:hypothetical protein
MKRFLVGLLVPVLVFCLAGVSFLADTRTEAKEEQIPFPEVPRVTKEELKELLGKPGTVILDCRPNEQFSESPQRIPGAVHEDPLKIPLWAPKYPKDARIIVY